MQNPLSSNRQTIGEFQQPYYEQTALIALSPLHSEPLERQQDAPTQGCLRVKNQSQSSLSQGTSAAVHTLSDMSQRRLRLYIPFGYPPYSCFYVLSLYHEQIQTAEVLDHVLTHLRIPQAEWRQFKLAYRVSPHP